jgi:hypothetical protein
MVGKKEDINKELLIVEEKDVVNHVERENVVNVIVEKVEDILIVEEVENIEDKIKAIPLAVGDERSDREHSSLLKNKK